MQSLGRFPLVPGFPLVARAPVLRDLTVACLRVRRRRLDQIKMMERAGKEELDRHQRLRIEEVTHLEAEVCRFARAAFC
jgi:hypothetical protein